ncbi:MAG: benzylsuccinate synthase gamma subunit family protein [Desulfobacterales bacterium]
MPTCKECKSFFPIEEEPGKGDCVQKCVDARQTYYSARVVSSEMDASLCDSFQKK